MQYRKLLAFILCTFSALLIPDTALAALQENNILDGIIYQYKSASEQWITPLTSLAIKLFWSLALIEISWTGISLALRGSDIQEFTGELVRRIFFLGFFYALLTHSAEWAQAIVESFRKAGAIAIGNPSAEPLKPSNIFDTGLELASKISEQVSFLSPADSVGLIISALIVMICFALMTAYLMLALIEMYIILSGGVFLLGFGGSLFTKDYALKYLIYAVGIGAKLFILQLILSVGEHIIRDFGLDFEKSMSQVYVLIGASVVLIAVVKIIPEIVQGLISGSSPASGASLVASAMMAAHAVHQGSKYISGKASEQYQQLKNAAKMGENLPGSKTSYSNLKNTLSSGRTSDDPPK